MDTVRWYLLECGHYGAPSPPGAWPQPAPNSFGEVVGCLPCSGVAADEGKVATVKRHVVKEVTNG